MKIKTSITIDKGILLAAQDLATKDKRSLSSYLELILEKKVKPQKPKA